MCIRDRSKIFLKKTAESREMVQDLRRAKSSADISGKNVVLYKFCKEVQHDYKFRKVHAEIAKALQLIIDDKCNRLIIQVPPRIGKSYLASKLFPAAYLRQHPDRNIGIISYSAELAEGFSRAAREYFRESGGSLNQYKQAVNDWGTQAGGGLWCAGVGGAVTGRSGHLLIVDDPVKNREDADSPKVMEKLWDFYTSTLYTRLEPKIGAIVVIQTRWSDNDLIGRLFDLEKNATEEGRENWTILDFPALYEDPGSRPKLPEHCTVVSDWRTEIDEAVCPQRYDTQSYKKTRETVGPREFAALYQQRPSPEGGNLFDPDWWQYYDVDQELENVGRCLLSVDCTFTDASNSDYVVATLVAQAGPNFYVVDMKRKRTDIMGTLAMINGMYKNHHVDGVIIEQAASGYAALQLLQRKIPGVIGFRPDKSKVARASGIIPIVEAGNVFLPKSATWLDAWVSEFSLFPASKNDDMVDSLSMAINYMAQRQAPQMTEATWGRATHYLGN